MRRSSRSFGPVAFAAFLALVPGARVLAEDSQFENTSVEGSQIVPAGPDQGPQSGASNLNTVPEDGMSSGYVAGPDSRQVRQLLAARPNEDLVICVAGCFGGRDRVVYAQPSEKLARAPRVAPQSSIQMPAAQHLSSSEPAPQTPRAPVVLNRTN